MLCPAAEKKQMKMECSMLAGTTIEYATEITRAKFRCIPNFVWGLFLGSISFPDERMMYRGSKERRLQGEYLLIFFILATKSQY